MRAGPSAYLTGRVTTKGPRHVDYTHILASHLCCFTEREVWLVCVNCGFWAAAHITVGLGGHGQPRADGSLWVAHQIKKQGGKSFWGKAV